MKNFLRGIASIFNLWPTPKNYDELVEEVNQDMQNLYDKHGWGKYYNPLDNNSYTTTTTTTTTYKSIRDPARPKTNRKYRK